MTRSPGRLLAVLGSDGPGGALARRLLPALVLALALLGVLRWQGERLGLYGMRVGVVLMTAAAIAVVSGLLLYFCRWLDQHEGERQQAEAQLRRSGRYFELSRDLLCTAGFDGCFKDLNAAWTNTLGWSDSELRSRPFVSFVHPEDREQTERETAKLATGEVTVDFVNRYQAKDGGWRWLEWSANASPEEGLIFASARDVSERRLTEGYLAAQHAATRVLAEAGSVEEALPALLSAIGEQMAWPVAAFWAPSRNGSGGELRCVAFWHTPGLVAKEFEAATKRLELAPGEGLPGRVLESGQPRWVADVTVEPHSRRTDAAVSAGLHACIVVPIVSGARVLAVIEFLSEEIRQPEPALLEMLDIVAGQIGLFLERKRSEAALELSERHTRQILETAREAFVSIDERGLVTAWNPQAETTFGWPREQALGRELAETIIPQAYRESHRRGIEHFLATGEAPVLGKPLELSALHRDGREFPVELTITALQTDEGYAFNAFVRDISERKRFEAELAQARDVALEASRHKSDFLANMSHEIRTPMNGVIGMTGLLLDTELEPEQREYAETVRSSGEALLSIINDILDFSKIEAGRLELETVDLDLRAVVEEVGALLAERAHAKGLELATYVDPDVATTVRGDPGRLRQVLTNLVGNAIKFTDAGEVVARAVLARETAEQLLVRLEVTDTGIGIAAAAQAALFEPFAQADASTTRTYGGTGLGLAISKQLVERMGGEIELESELGRGSTFSFTVPLGKQAEPAGARATHAELAGLRVLIVDDNATNRAILEHQLSSCGMHSVSVERGAAALEALRSAAASGLAFDLALLDMEMPAMNGLELARAIRAEPALASIPLMLLTSSGVRGTSEETRQAGIAAQLTKPVRQSQLFDAIATVIGARSAKTTPVVKRDTASAERASSRPRLLVAEDNPVNQKVAAAMLAKLGWQADVVSDGAEAVKALSKGSYGAVLMDVHMPEMNGYAAATEIRRTEQAPARVPIIAMTASAVQGEREKCLAAGMDDYISKPVDVDALDTALERWVEGENERPDARPEGGQPIAAALDPDRRSVLRSLQHEGGPDVLAELIGPFLDETTTELAELRAALDAHDADALKQTAHALKGSSANLGAPGLAALCAELEHLGRSGELTPAAEILSRLETELDRVRTALHAELQKSAGH